MRYATVCSGIEAPSCAWHPLGWSPVFFSEIEAFPSAVYETTTMVAHSLRADGFDASEDGTGRGTPLVPVAFAQNQREEVRELGVAGALASIRRGDAKNETLLAAPVAFTCSEQANGFAWERPFAPTINAQVNVRCVVQTGVRIGMQVRRLTPRECERLQGFEDDYTLVTYRGKPAADDPRYKALGNSMAVPVVRWIGERIAKVDQLVSPTIPVSIDP